MKGVKGIVWPFEFGGRYYAHSIRYNKMEARQVFYFIFNDKVSREEPESQKRFWWNQQPKATLEQWRLPPL